MIPRETNLLGQVIRQEIQQVAIAALVEQWFVRELGFFVRQAGRRFGVGGAATAVVRDGEVEVEG